MILSNQHEMQWSSATPGLLIFLLDQNVGDLQLAQRIVDTVNKVIFDAILRNCYGDKIKNRCFISLIGYNHNVKELCSGWLEELFENPLRYETLKKKTPDGAGGICEVDIRRPIWIESLTKGESTNMFGALQLAKDLAEKWIADNPDGPAPVIINISNGMPFSNEKGVLECVTECKTIAHSLRSLSCSDGNVLLYNAVFKSAHSTLIEDEKYSTTENFINDISSNISALSINRMNIVACQNDFQLFKTMQKGYILTNDVFELQKFVHIILEEIFRRHLVTYYMEWR